MNRIPFPRGFRDEGHTRCMFMWRLSFHYQRHHLKLLVLREPLQIFWFQLPPFIFFSGGRRIRLRFTECIWDLRPRLLHIAFSSHILQNVISIPFVIKDPIQKRFQELCWIKPRLKKCQTIVSETRKQAYDKSGDHSVLILSVLARRKEIVMGRDSLSVFLPKFFLQPPL